jgi:hypothetical protein
LYRVQLNYKYKLLYNVKNCLKICFCKYSRGVTGISLNDGKWNHLCFTWTNQNGAWIIYKNGVNVKSGSGLKSGLSVGGGGTFVLGNDQDFVGGGFSPTESIQGYLSQVNLWDKVIAKEKIQEMATSCKYKMEGNVVSWSEFKTGARGDAKILVPSKCMQNL